MSLVSLMTVLHMNRCRDTVLQMRLEALERDLQSVGRVFIYSESPHEMNNDFENRTLAIRHRLQRVTQISVNAILCRGFVQFCVQLPTDAI